MDFATADLIDDHGAEPAVTHGWAGVMINRAVRDVAALREPAGETGVPVTFGGVGFRPVAWLYGDEDGIVPAARRLV